jgi:hypothetical protein
MHERPGGCSNGPQRVVGRIVPSAELGAGDRTSCERSRFREKS